MSNFLMWVAGALALALAALFAVPPIIDWNQFRGVFEEEVSRVLGREVRVGGRVNLRILPVPYVRFEKVRIADAPGIPGSFVRIANFTMLLSVPPLLRGIVEARELELDGLTLRLRFDEKGGGNWQKLNIRQQDLAFVPSDFALQSARIRKGSVIVESSAGREIARVDGIDGELVASALRGPYRFAGQAVIAGAPLDLRVATAAANRDGGIVLTATARNGETEATYGLQGRLSDLEQTPKLIGEVTSRAPLRVGRESAADAPAAFYEVRAKTTIDHASVAMDDVVISFDSAGRPQQLAGQLRTTWQDELNIEGRLKSKWLDLDAITGGRTKQDPLQAMWLISDGGTAIASGRGKSAIQFEIEQANLGGAVASALAVTFVRTGGEVRAERVRANLPGRARLRAEAVLATADGVAGWQGHAMIRGANFARYSQWMWPEKFKVDGTAAGAFEFSADIATAPAAFEINRAMLKIAGRRSHGSIKYDWTKKPLLTVDWSADSLDLSGFGDDALSNANLTHVFGLKPRPGSKLGPLQRQFREADFDVRLQALEISDAHRTFGDVDILLSRTGKRLRLGKSKLTIEPGLSLELEGEVTGIDAEPNWDLSGLVGIRSAKAYDELSALIAHISGDVGLPAALRASHPLNLAVATSSGQVKGRRETHIEADGSLHGDRLRLSFKTDGELQNWRRNPMQVNAKIDGLTTRTVAKLLRGTPPARAAGGARARDAGREEPVARPSFLRLNIIGIPHEGLNASATLVSDIWQLRLRGRAEPVKPGAALHWAGNGFADLRDVRHVAGLFDQDWRKLFPERVAAGGHFKLAQDETGWMIEPVDFAVAGSTVGGRLQIADAKPETPRVRVTGALTVDRVDAAGIATPLLSAKAPGAREGASDGEQGTGSAWPDRPFDLAALSLVDADVSLDVRRVDLAARLRVRDARIAFKTENGSLTFKQTAGRLLGGTIASEARLTSAPAGVRFDGTLALTGAGVGALVTKNLRSRVGGRFSLNLKGSGQALSPRALATALRADGRLDVKALRVPGLPAAALSKIADGVVVGDVPPEDLNAQITEALAGGAVMLGSHRLGVKVADGALLIADIAHRAGGARLVNQTTIDIVRMAFDSQWRVDTVLNRALDPGQSIKALPTVQVVYTGPIVDLARIEPTVNTGDLQRELTVQRMEHDVRRLERLRKEDEARAKAEAERLRQLELDQKRALEEEARKRGQLPAVRSPRLTPGTTSTANERRASTPVQQTTSSAIPSQSPGSVATPNLTRQPLPPVISPPGQPPSTSNAASETVVTQQAQPVEPPAPPRRRVRKRRKKWDPFNTNNN